MQEERGARMDQVRMGDARSLDSGAEILLSPDVFAWKAAGIVLLLVEQDRSWIVIRGWQSSDQLRHIRRWSFDTPSAATGQIRRLVRDAAGDHETAAIAASRWLAAPAPDGQVITPNWC